MATSRVRASATSRRLHLVRDGIAILTLLCVFLSGDRTHAKSIDALTLSKIKNPGGHDSLSPTVSARLDGDLVLSWFESPSPQMSLRYSIWK